MTQVRQKQSWNSGVGTVIADTVAYDDTQANTSTMVTPPTVVEETLLWDMNNIRSQINRLIHGNALPGGAADRFYNPVSTFGVNSLAEATRLCSTSLIETIALGSALDVLVLDNSGPPDEVPTEVMAVDVVTTEGAVVATLGGAVGTADGTAVVPGDAGITIQPKNLVTIIDLATNEPLIDGGKQVWGLLQVASTAVDGAAFPTTATAAQLTLVTINAGRTGFDVHTTTAAFSVQYVYVQRLEVQNLPEDCAIAPTFVDNSGSVDVTRENAYANQGTVAVDLTTNATLDLEGPGLVWSIRDDLEAALFSITEGSAGDTSSITFGSEVDTFDNDAAVNDFKHGASFDTDAAGTTIGIGTTANTITSGGVLNLDATGDVDVTLIAGERLDLNQAGDETNAIIAMRSSSTAGTDEHGIFSGDGDPNATISALAGSLMLDDTGAAWINTSGADTVGTVWTALSTGSVEDRQDVYDQQAGTVVTQGDYNATLDIGTGGRFWEIGDLNSDSILRITESSATNLTTFAVDADAITLTGLAPATTGTGGIVTIVGGTGGTGGGNVGGAVDIDGGDAGLGSGGAGGRVRMIAGDGNGVGTGGDADVIAGAGGASSATGGAAFLRGGDGGAAAGTGGDVHVGVGFGPGAGLNGSVHIGDVTSGTLALDVFIAASNEIDLDSGGTVDINSAGATTIDAGSTIDLNPTGDVNIALVSGESLQLTQGGDQTDALLQLTNTTGSGDLFVVDGDPNATVTGFTGSLAMDEDGAVWVNTSAAGGSGTVWTRLATTADAEDRQDIYDNQGVTPVDLTTNAILDLEGAGLIWSIRDDLEADVFAITEGSAGGTTDVTLTTGTYNMTSTGQATIDGGAVYIEGTSPGTLGLGAVEIVTETSAGVANIFLSPGGRVGEGLIGNDVDVRPGAGGGSTGQRGRLHVYGAYGEDEELLSLDAGDGIFGNLEVADFYVGTTSPDGVVSAGAGSTKYVDNGTTGELWVNTTPGNVDGIEWEKVQTDDGNQIGPCQLQQDTVGSAINGGTGDAVLTPYDSSKIAGLDPNCIRLSINGVLSRQSAHSTGFLAFASNGLTNGDTVVLGASTYTARTVGTFTDSAGEFVIGSTVDETIRALTNAINLGPGVGTLYGTGTVLNASATATAALALDRVTVAAKEGGTGGDSIVTTETSAVLSWGAATLGGGSDLDFRYTTSDGTVTWMPKAGGGSGTGVNLDTADRYEFWAV